MGFTASPVPEAVLYLPVCPLVEYGEVIIHSPKFAVNVLHGELLVILTPQGGQGGPDQELYGADMGNIFHLWCPYSSLERQNRQCQLF